MSRLSVTAVASAAAESHTSNYRQHQNGLWEMNTREQMDQVGPPAYPVREGEPDCSYYIRTGLCRFGETCRFNHPTNRKLAIASARMKGEYPERTGQPECQYYIKTGTCKFGSTCKFDHSKENAGIAGRVALNVLGYPLRPNEIDCAYFMRNGHCKFGSTCKFHHPHPSGMVVSLRGYPPIHSQRTGQIQYPLSRTSFIPSPSSYAPMVMSPQGVVSSVPGWNAYSGTVGSVSSSDNQVGYNKSSEFESGSSAFPLGMGGYYAFHTDTNHVFPERLGQPECQFYIKTGDCKFGAGCKFHHPRQRIIPPPDCVLSPIGLPLRPGEPLCVFYSRYGICKFGPSCKFDHSMRVFSHHAAAPAVDRFLASSSGNVALSLSEARHKSSSGENNINSNS